MKHLLISYFSIALFSVNAFSEVEHFKSGLFKSYTGNEKVNRRQEPEKSLQEFIESQFSNLSGEYSWVRDNTLKDKTHLHAGFSLKYKTRTVLDRGLKVNVLQNGNVESALSNFENPFILFLPESFQTDQNLSHLKERLWKEWRSKLGVIKGDIRIEPVIWIDPGSQVGYPAFDVRLVFDSPWLVKRFIVHEITGNVLEEKQTTRNASASVKVYKVSPYSNSTPDSVTLSDLNDTSSLKNSYLWVRRERISGSTTETVEVVPQDYRNTGDGGACSASSFQADPSPSQYNYTCTGAGTSCCNMAFDAVNAYYHLSNFRSYINTYLTQLGASISFTYDPLNVLINPVSLDFGTTGLDDDANNALYVGEPCRSDGSMDRCMVFLRPAQLTTSAASATCGQSSATLKDLAREAIVVAHEYQHYVTDMVTHIAFSASGSPKVGDAIHEGYSDYLAASYVTNLAATDTTLVGQYALQQCTPLQRQLNTLRVYDENDVENNEDVHLPGLSWASAFWKLRTEYGKEVADLLALKSLFFLSTTPGFIDSIEAVVQADQALYSGTHVDRIRRLFYSEITFTGKNSLSASGIGEIGFKGCAAVHGARRPENSTIIFTVLFFLGVLFIGRRSYFRRSIS